MSRLRDRLDVSFVPRSAGVERKRRRLRRMGIAVSFRESGPSEEL
jgi:hypothetical protein